MWSVSQSLTTYLDRPQHNGDEQELLLGSVLQMEPQSNESQDDQRDMQV